MRKVHEHIIQIPPFVTRDQLWNGLEKAARHPDRFVEHMESRYSTINRYTYSDSTGPTFVCTYAQTQLLLAEAAVRGWVDGSAQTYYENGVRAACGSSHSSPTARRCIISI